MKKLTILLFSLALFFSIVGTGHTTSYTWTDELTWNNKLIKWWDSFSYEHDISDGTNGFVPGEDFVNSYSLRVTLSGDGGICDGGEVAFINQPGILGDGFYNFSWTSQTFGWSLRGRADINNTGILGVTITSLFGDFYLNNSYLKAEGCKVSTPVPEPGTMLMLGFVLLGLVGVSRKRFNNRN